MMASSLAPDMSAFNCTAERWVLALDRLRDYQKARG